MSADFDRKAYEWIRSRTGGALSSLYTAELSDIFQRIDREARESCAKLCEESVEWAGYGAGYEAICLMLAKRIRAQIQPDAPVEGGGT